jgi:hypothetical protein
MLDKLTDYLLGQADKMTAWIGFLGIVLYLTGFHSLLIFLFLGLIALPEAQFSTLFQGWTTKLRAIDKRK